MSAQTLNSEFLDKFYGYCLTSKNIQMLEYFCDKFMKHTILYKKETLAFLKNQNMLYQDNSYFWKEQAKQAFVEFFTGKIKLIDDSSCYMSVIYSTDLRAEYARKLKIMLDKQIDVMPILEKHHDISDYFWFVKQNPTRINPLYIENMKVGTNYRIPVYKAMLELIKFIPPSIKGIELVQKIYHVTDNLNVKEQAINLIEAFPQEFKATSKVRRQSIEHFITETEKHVYHYDFVISHELLKEYTQLSSNQINKQSFAVLRALHQALAQFIPEIRNALRYSENGLHYESENALVIERIKTFLKPIKENASDFIAVFDFNEIEDIQRHIQSYLSKAHLSETLSQPTNRIHKGNKI